jgi:phage-related protein
VGNTVRMVFDLIATSQLRGFTDTARAAEGTTKAVNQTNDSLNKLGANTATPKIKLDGQTEAQAAAEKLRVRLADLARNVTDVKIRADDKAGLAAVANMTVKLDKLGAKVANPKIDLKGVNEALAGVASVDLALDRLGKKTVTPKIDTSGIAKGVIGGIGPGIPGVSARAATGIAAGGLGLAALPAGVALQAAGGVASAGIGVISAGAQQLTEKGGPLFNQAATVKTAAETAMKTAATGMLAPLKQAFDQIPAMLKNITPALTSVFAGAGTMIAPLLNGVNQLAKTVLPLLGNAFRAVSPLITPIMSGLSQLAAGVLPGLITMLQAAKPAVDALSGILGTLGRDLGAAFTAMAPAIGASSVIFKALGDVLGAILPIVANLAATFATALAPVFTQFAGVIKALLPVLTIIGNVFAELAKAVLLDLVAAFSAVAQLLKAIAPALSAFATAFGQVFVMLENSGVFAILGNALESLVAPLAALINALLNGLRPILPIVIGFISQLAGILVQGLVQAVTALMPVMIRLVNEAFKVLMIILPVVIPMLITLAQIFTGAVVAVLQGVATALLAIINAIPPAVLNAIVIGILALVAGFKAFAIAKSIIEGVQGAMVVFGNSSILAAAKTAAAWVASTVPIVASFVAQAAAATAAFIAENLATLGIIAAITALVAAIVWVATHWSQTWAIITAAASAAWHFITGIFSDVAGFFGRIFANVSAPIIAVFNGIKSFFTGWWNTLVQDWKNDVGLIENLLSAAWNAVSNTAKAVWNAIKSFFTGWWNTLVQDWKNDVGLIENLLSAAWNAVSNTAKAVWNAIKSFFTGWWNGLKTEWNAAVEFVKALLSAGWNAIKNTATATWNAIKAFFTQFWTNLKADWNAAVEFVKTLLSNAWNSIKSVASTVWGAITSFFSDFWTKLKNSFGAAVDWIKSRLSTAWADIQASAKQSWDNITSAIKTAIRDVGNAVRIPIEWVIENPLNGGIIKGFNWISSKVGGPQIPDIPHIPTVPSFSTGVVGAFANGVRQVPGYGGGDKHLALLEAGESVVPKELTPTLAGWLKANGVPGHQFGWIGDVLGAVSGSGVPGTGVATAFGAAWDMAKITAAITTQNVAALTNAFNDLTGSKGSSGAVAELGKLLVAVPKELIKSVVAWIVAHITGGGSGGDIVSDAMGWLGKIPYVMGGTTLGPAGADCSGFAQAIYGRHGITAPRTSEAQGAWVKRSGPTPGGLAFYVSPAGGPPPGHVAIVKDASTVISQGGGMGPKLMGLNAMPLMWTGIPPGGFPAKATGYGGGGIGGGGTQQWRDLALQAMQMVGLNPNLLGVVLSQMQTESGGNPNAINLTDSNAIAGHPSKGLMQVIDGTFALYHVAGTSSNIYDPLANIAAGLNYAKNIYGPNLSGLGQGHGYARGSWDVPLTGPATVHQGEMILPAEFAEAVRGALGGGGGSGNVERLLKQLIAVSASQGEQFGRALNGVAGAAGFRSRYPAGGA